MAYLWLDVSVDKLVLIQVSESCSEVAHEVLSHRLREAPSRTNKLVEVSSGTEFEDKVDVGLCLHDPIELDDVLVPKVSEDGDLGLKVGEKLHGQA